MPNEFKVSGNFADLMSSKSVTPSIRRSFAGVMSRKFDGLDEATQAMRSLRNNDGLGQQQNKAPQKSASLVDAQSPRAKVHDQPLR